MNKKITVKDSWQSYQYILTEKPGDNFHEDFHPDLTPAQMLALGVFGGTYFNDRPKEFPSSWFKNAKLSGSKTPNKELNYFNISASQSLEEWKRKGWIYDEDPRGWFQWYCRYYMGRRIKDEDLRQIKRWKAMKRHVAQVRKNCTPGDELCRQRQRQALLHWAYDSRKM